MSDYEAGIKAFHDGLGAAECPYAFDNSVYWESKDYRGFEVNLRGKLNEWMRGWLAAKDKKRAT